MNHQTFAEAQSPSPAKLLDDAKQRIADLENELLQATAEAEFHNQAVEAEFEERLIEYEAEVLQLKLTIERCTEEKKAMQEEMDNNRKKYSENIQRLKKGLRTMQDSHREYLDKVMRAIESANKEHSHALDEVRRDRDTKVGMLQAEIDKLREKGKSDMPVQHKDAAREAHRLARKAAKIVSSERIAAIVEKSNSRPGITESDIEDQVSKKARNVIYRLERLVGQSPQAISDRQDCDEEVISALQQQLVRAYEDIERLQDEVDARRPYRT
jgi:hypothetical protein